MYLAKNLTHLSVIAFTALNSPATLAAEEATSSSLPAIWPFLVFVGLVVVFHKQLNCVPPIDLSDTDDSTQVIAKNNNVDEEIAEATTPINLKDNSGQCQASTAKGIRCKRKNTLEDATISIEGIDYLIAACAQHHNDALKPYPELINLSL